MKKNPCEVKFPDIFQTKWPTQSKRWVITTDEQSPAMGEGDHQRWAITSDGHSSATGNCQ